VNISHAESKATTSHTQPQGVTQEPYARHLRSSLSGTSPQGSPFSTSTNTSTHLDNCSGDNPNPCSSSTGSLNLTASQGSTKVSHLNNHVTSSHSKPVGAVAKKSVSKRRKSVLVSSRKSTSKRSKPTFRGSKQSTSRRSKPSLENSRKSTSRRSKPSLVNTRKSGSDKPSPGKISVFCLNY